jgi:methylmalonyl-CoA mutase cobalamin-binding subunit
MNACAAGKSAPTIVVTTPAGQIHEFGALLVGAAAAALGWRVTYLGTSLPGWDIADVARRLEADAIALSIVYPADDPSLPAELVALRDAVGAEMEILVGGRAASNYIEAIQAIQATPMTELSQLVSFLQSRTTGIQEATAG